jgi:Na+-transporting NADH:ubiquinone oxidoreductase subunit C
MKKESIGYVVAFTFIVCIVFVLGLSVVNYVTIGQVEANRRYAAHVAVLKALGLADASTSPADVEATYGSQIKEIPGEKPAYVATIDGVPAVAVRYTGPGLWGSITAIVAADAAGTRLRGLELLDQQETPGLGGRIDEPWFKDQFRNEKVGDDGKILVDRSGSGTGDKDSENARVDAVSGASRTSDFMQGIVNGALEAIRKTGGSL